MMSVAPRPTAGPWRLPVPLRRALAGIAAVPWRERAFWATQLLVVGAVGIHLAHDAYSRHLAGVPAVTTLLLTLVPVGYAAIRFGLRGSLPTALWTAVLMAPDIVVVDTGLERWTDGTVLALVLIVAVAAGRMVDVQRASAAALAATERLRGIARVADQLAEGICLVDLGGVITYANPVWASMQGLGSAAAAVGRPLASFHGEEEAQGASLPYHGAVPLGAGPPVRQVIQHHPPGRAPYWADVTVAALVDERGAVIGRLCTVRDVTAERAAAAALTEAEERSRFMFEHAPLGMALTTPEGGFLRVNGALCQMLGRTADELVRLGVWGLTHRADRLVTRQALGGSGGQIVKRLRHADGHFVSVSITIGVVRDEAGEPCYFISQFQDVTQEQLRQSQLLHRASHDPLTGLPNRVLFEDRADRALARAHRRPEVLAVLFCDLDDFKVVNDRLGHEAGDEFLRAVATRLQGCVRETDTVARFGGDEFLVLLEDVGSSDEATATAARVLDALRRPAAVDGQEVAVSASIGIALTSGAPATRRTLIKEADAAMYQAKAGGGDRWQLAPPARPRRARRRAGPADPGPQPPDGEAAPPPSE